MRFSISCPMFICLSKIGLLIDSYILITSVDGITGRFQQELLVHNKKSEPCITCKTEITKIVVNGRGTYFCPKCQKHK